MAFNNGGSDITLINEEGLTLTVEQDALTPQNTNPNTEHSPKQRIRLSIRYSKSSVVQNILWRRMFKTTRSCKVGDPLHVGCP
jgi:hypothetical protein